MTQAYLKHFQSLANQLQEERARREREKKSLSFQTREKDQYFISLLNTDCTSRDTQSRQTDRQCVSSSFQLRLGIQGRSIYLTLKRQYLARARVGKVANSDKKILPVTSAIRTCKKQSQEVGDLPREKQKQQQQLLLNPVSRSFSQLWSLFLKISFDSERIETDEKDRQSNKRHCEFIVFRNQKKWKCPGFLAVKQLAPICFNFGHMK